MSSSPHRLRSSCRACGSRSLERFLELGPQPLANSFLKTRDQAEAAFPLDVYFCPSCSLVQLLDVIDPEVLFRDYIYVTGTSETMRRHFAGYAAQVVADLAIPSGALVVEAASNDGTLLASFQEHGVRTLGVEPARNIAAIARARGVNTVEEFFGLDSAARLRRQHGAAHAVVGNNVLAHVDDPVDFLRGAAEFVAPGGWVIIEAPYLGEMLERLEYDTVYHEHLCYFSVNALMRLFEEAGLRIDRLMHVPVHGGSLRVFGRPAAVLASHGEQVLEWARRESADGMTSIDRYRAFARDVAENRRQLRQLLCSLRSEGKRLAGYGAPAKGNTLLNYCGLGDLLEFTVDQSPHKVGLYTPGQRLPVLPASALAEQRPDYAVLLAWNFAEEVLRQQEAYRSTGGRFILPIPKPKVL